MPGMGGCSYGEKARDRRERREKRWCKWVMVRDNGEEEDGDEGREEGLVFFEGRTGATELD